MSASGALPSMCCPSCARLPVVSSRSTASSRRPPTASTSSRSTPRAPRACTAALRVWRLGLTGRGHAVGDEEDARILFVGQRLAEPTERASKIGGTERTALQEPLHVGGPETVRLSFIERHDLLVEGGDRDRRRAAGTGAQTGDQLVQAAHLGGIAQGARGARIEEDVEAGDLFRHALDRCRDTHDGQIAIAQAGPLGAFGSVGRSILADLEVAVRRPVPLVQLDDAAVAHLAAEVARRSAGGRTAAEKDADVEPADLGQSMEGEDIGLVRPRHGVRIGDDDLLARPRRDREDAGRELVAGLLFEEGRVLAAVKEVFIGLAGALALHHLALLPAAGNLQSEAGEGGAGRQGDAEAAFHDLIPWVLEGQVQLGERERRLEDAVGLQGHQGEAGAVGGGEADRSGVTLRRPLGRGLLETERSGGLGRWKR